MAIEGVNGTNIPLNPTKSRIIGRGWKMVIKEEENNRTGDPGKKEEGRTRERKWEESLLVFIL